jgi:type II secretory pathway component PulF
MPAFEYQALDPAGREQRGLLEGDSPRQSRQMLIPVLKSLGLVCCLLQQSHYYIV